MANEVKKIFGIPSQQQISGTNEVFGLLPDDVREQYAKRRKELIELGIAGGATQTEAAVGTILGDFLGGTIAKALGREDPEMVKAEAREANLANLRETLKDPSPESLSSIGLEMLASSSDDDRAFGSSLVQLALKMSEANQTDVTYTAPTNEERTEVNNLLDAWAGGANSFDRKFDIGDYTQGEKKIATGVTAELAAGLEALKDQDRELAKKEGRRPRPVSDLFDGLMRQYLSEGRLELQEDTGFFGTGILKGDPEIKFNLGGSNVKQQQEAVRNESMGMDATGQALVDKYLKK